MSVRDIYDPRHYNMRDYRQRMTVQDWRKILLADEDYLIFKGDVLKMKAKNLGFGVVEVWKQFKVPKTTEEDKT